MPLPKLPPLRTLPALLLAAALLLPALPVQAQDSDRRARSRDFVESLELFGRVYERIMRNYVDEMPPDELIDAAIEGMLDQLDPHTSLLREELYDDLMVSTQGEFGGLGIQITIRDDYPTVISPIEGTPAARLGIMGGDQIVEIEGESTEGWSSSDAVKRLRGPKGSEVTIGIRRYGKAKVIPFTIVRDTIKIESVPYAFMVDDEIGYIRISNFARSTVDELKEKIDGLEGEGMQKLILDLRFNPGGLLQSAKDVSELFLEKGDLIVYTKGRLAQQNMSYYATSQRGRFWKDHPLVVMVNGSSASASEILAGAIQDHDVGVVLGQQSFGKGSVQTVFELSPTEALKLTTAKYYTPSGRSIHLDRPRHGEEGPEGDELAEEDTIDPEDREVYYTEGGREVYGGGGILPDVLVDPTLLSDFAVALERDATAFHFATRWLGDHGETAEPGFELTQADLDAFWELAQEREQLPGFFEDAELEMSRELFAEHSGYIEEAVRREITRRVADAQEAYKVSLSRDGQVDRAIELLRQAGTPAELFAAAADLQARLLAEADARAAEDEAETARMN